MPATEFGGVVGDRVYRFDVAGLDLASHGAGAAADTTVTVPAGVTLRAADHIVAIPPLTLEAGIVPIACRYVSATTFKLRCYNPSGAGVDPAAATWSFVVIGN